MPTAGERSGRETAAFPRSRAGRLASLLGHYVRFNLSAGMEYRVSFLMQVFGMALNNAAFLVFWAILYDRLDSIKGYGFQDVMFLWSLSSLGYGIAAVLMGNAYFLSRAIYNAELDVYLLQPKPVLANFLFSRMGVSGWGDIGYGIILFFSTQALTPGHIILFLFFSLTLAVVLTSLRVFYHSFTFFLGNAEELAVTVSDLIISFMIYPGGIFEGPAAIILHSLIPAALVAYIPAEIFRSFDMGRLLEVTGADILIVAAAALTFRLGLRAYESGSRMGARL